MGTGASLDKPAPTRYVHVKHGNRVAKVRIEALCCRKEIQEAIALAAGLDRRAEFTLRDACGTITLSNALLNSNGIRDPYEITEVHVPQTEAEKLVDATNLLSEQLKKIMELDEFKKDIAKKLTVMETRLDRETMRFSEVAKIQDRLHQLEETVAGQTKNMIDFVRFRPSASFQDTYYVPQCDPTGIMKPRREMWWGFTKYQLSEETTNYLKTPTFDIWQWDLNEVIQQADSVLMVVLLEYMYQELGLMEEFHINVATFRRWLLAVQEHYRNNPFHNFRHAFCVAQMMYGLIHVCQLRELFSKQELLVMLTSAVCHDVDHPGFNNTYQINARTELAIRYNDVSPLEQHHCAVTFKLLTNPDWNFLCNVSDEDMRAIRKGMIELILATDMARHAEILDGFRAVAANFDPKIPEHMTKLKMVLMKACDISNEVRPMDISGPWVECLLEEYFQQAERERSLGLPVAPFMDKNKVTKATAQIGFIQFVLLPLFEALAKVFPQLQEMMVIPLQEAQQYYTNLKEEESKG